MADDNALLHYGILRRSGRYPWGSGEDPTERSRGFQGYVNDLKSKGVSETDIAKGLGVTTTELRAAKAIARNETAKADSAQALRLKSKGMSNVAIGARMGINESSVRTLLDPAVANKREILLATSELLKSKIDDENYLDIGEGTSNHLSISKTKLANAVAVLREQGYEQHNIQVDQLGTANKTTVKVLSPPGTKYVDIVRNPTRIKSVAAYSENGGKSYTLVKPPVNVDSKRVGVRYAEQGGANADGVIYVRRGVPDLSLGSSRYAQVRIAVDGTHYLKGMAMYNDSLPEGTDLLFNTNKSDTGNKLDAMKSQKDEDNPFGATVHQKTYIGDDGKEHLSPMNIVNEEGDWRDWSRSLSSQVLSKQSTALAKRQLDLAFASRSDEFDEISRLTNPVVKKKLLESFADGADSASVHLKAAALPGQGTHVILPIESLKENEIYAPNYKNGEKVALIRFPHGGTFEIPEVTVNNKNAEARASLGFPQEGNPFPKAVDAVGIHPKVAERLSGADFDGDTVLVIPNGNGAVKTSAPLKDLQNFDPKTAYPEYEGMKPISSRSKQQQMGDVSNLITDMTIKGANPDELARAVRHSMVVIDAEKHNLNYRQSYVDSGIASLKEKYQGRGATGRLAGASTIIAKSGNAEIKVPEKVLRKASQGGAVDAATGKKVYVQTGASYVDKKSGKTVVKLSTSKPLLETEDARTLSSGTPIENIYANHSNRLKALANEARKEALTTGGIDHSTSATKTYSAEVASLNSKLNIALKNKPRERQAQLIANAVVSAKVKDNPGIESSDLKKLKGQELDTARKRVGAKKELIDISPGEWAAIQAGAITTNKLRQILDNADTDKVKALATPRTALEVTPSKLALAKARLASGYTQAEIAESLGIPVSTLNAALHREGGSSG
jgi:DNA-binding CsgD family transcriptional regulator